MRPVSANVSATTAARWGVNAGAQMVEQAAGVESVMERHAKSAEAHRPADAAGSKGRGGGKKEQGEGKPLFSQMRVRSAGGNGGDRVPVPPAERPRSGPPTSSARPPAQARQHAERVAAEQQRYRALMGYGDKADKENERGAPTHRRLRPSSAATARPASATATPPTSVREELERRARLRPASARERLVSSSPFGDSQPGSAKPLTKRRAASAGPARRGRGGGASAESDAWLKGILAETQQLISSVKSEQVALTAEADRLQGQLWSASGFNKGSVSEAAQQQLPPRLGGKREQT